MEVDCEGCAGCCIDWRALTDAVVDHERRGPFDPLDDTDNLVPLLRDEVCAFVDAGYGDALRPRLWRARDDRSVSLGGVDVAAIGGKPVFFVGLCKPPKPVGPFDTDPAWLPTCVFLDPRTLQCRIHDGDLYPRTCARYPGENLRLDVETECERVERTFGGDRLRDGTPPDVEPMFGPAAVGSKVFAHPDPPRIADAVRRFHDGEPTRADRAEFVGVAAGSSPGLLAVNEARYEAARDAVREADSWVGRAIDDWRERAERDDPDPAAATAVEDERGAPSTPGWD